MSDTDTTPIFSQDYVRRHQRTLGQILVRTALTFEEIVKGEDYLSRLISMRATGSPYGRVSGMGIMANHIIHRATLDVDVVLDASEVVRRWDEEHQTRLIASTAQG